MSRSDEPQPKSGQERLHKVLANAGVASRRDAERLITEGHVTVNGKMVTTLPAFADPEVDDIRVDGRPLKTQRQLGKALEHVYVAYYKPRGIITTTHDPEGRRSVTDMVKLPSNLPQRIYPVGRLDADSSGLLLLTNDGDLANHLTHPRYEVAKQYLVAVRGRLSQEDMTNLREGIMLAHRRGGQIDVKRATMARVELIGYGRDRNDHERTNIAVTLFEGQNREIRRMIAALGHKVRRLRRVAIGPLTLKGLAVGEWRLLSEGEVRSLKRASDQTEGAPAGAGPMRDKRPRRSGPPRPAGGGTRGGSGGGGFSRPRGPSTGGGGKPFTPKPRPRRDGGGPAPRGGQGQGGGGGKPFTPKPRPRRDGGGPAPRGGQGQGGGRGGKPPRRGGPRGPR
jgi:pseudouridine synthase